MLLVCSAAAVRLLGMRRTREPSAKLSPRYYAIEKRNKRNGVYRDHDGWPGLQLSSLDPDKLVARDLELQIISQNRGIDLECFAKNYQVFSS